MMPRRKFSFWIGFAGLIFLSFVLARFFIRSGNVVEAFFTHAHPGLAAPVFIVVFVLSSFVILDTKDILKIAAALAFGALGSALLIWLAELVNCWLLFRLARRYGREWVERRFAVREKSLSWVKRFYSTGAIFALRSLPVFPYRILDVAYGLSELSFRKYFVISALSSPIRIFWLQFILAAMGAAVFDQQKMIQYLQANPGFLRASLLYILASLVAAFFIGRRLK